MKKLNILALPLLALACESSLAQQLSLFESLASSSEATEMRPMPAQAMASMEVPAGFTLQSLSRFGDEYHGVLLDANGNPVRLRWTAGEEVTLPGYAGVAVLGADDGAGLLLQQPLPCQPNEQQGVSCSSGNVARLTLATRAPLQDQAAQQQARLQEAREQASRQPRDAGTLPQSFRSLGRRGEVLIDENGNTIVLNAASAEQMGPEQLQALINARVENVRQRFQGVNVEVQSVGGDEVPPGMRVVRTRFGDRLVPVRD